MNVNTVDKLRRFISQHRRKRSFATFVSGGYCNISSIQPRTRHLQHEQFSPQHPIPRVSIQRFSSQDKGKIGRDQIITDEGIILHQADPSKSDGQGLVWGSVLWPSGVSLAKYLHYRYSEKAGSSRQEPLRVLELGCGTGIVGLTLAKCLPTSQISLTDSESALWPLLRKNIDCNIAPNSTTIDGSISLSSDEKRVVIHGLDWRDPSTFLPAQDFDLVVAADVLYAGMDKLFARALASHLLCGQNDALVACPFRKDSPLEGFFGACHRLGLKLDRLEDEDGRASGAHFGRDPFQAYDSTRFVPLEESKMEQITVSPSFAAGNDQNVQIFRIRRVEGEPQDAIQIRRVSRI